MISLSLVQFAVHETEPSVDWVRNELESLHPSVIKAFPVDSSPVKFSPTANQRENIRENIAPIEPRVGSRQEKKPIKVDERVRMMTALAI